jgi:hypothetical protein
MQSTLFAVISLYNSILKLGPQGVTLLLFKVNYPLSLKKKKKHVNYPLLPYLRFYLYTTTHYSSTG